MIGMSPAIQTRLNISASPGFTSPLKMTPLHENIEKDHHADADARRYHAGFDLIASPYIRGQTLEPLDLGCALHGFLTGHQHLGKPSLVPIKFSYVLRFFDRLSDNRKVCTALLTKFEIVRLG
jgi:hypothetical protein